MQYFSALEQIPEGFGPSAVTFGKFDGVHLGHRFIVDSLRDIARERNLVPTVVTFDRNPLSLLAPDRAPESLTSSAQKRELLEREGVEAVLEITFDTAFSLIPAAEFVEKFLVGALNAATVIVGPDTRFGHRGAGDFALLAELGQRHGFDALALPPHPDAAGARVSSTAVRELLASGNVSGAAAVLGRFPSLRAVIVHGEHRGRALGFPTANLSPELEGFIPADGVYAGFLTVRGERMPAAVSVGNNPTFAGVAAKQVEAHVIGRDLDLYDEIATLEFVERIRGQVAYTTVDALIAQITLDTAQASALLS